MAGFDSTRGRINQPNLDDRTWSDIVAQARALIPTYAPQWNDLNPSDLGMTLVELFAWLVEGLIFRLNQVPDKNYIAFLNLLGITRDPPTPARVYLTFTAQPAAVTVPQGAQAQTKGTETDPPIVFETDEEILNVLPINMTTAVELQKQGGSPYSNVSTSLTAPPAGGLTLTVPVGEAYLLCLGFDQPTADPINLRIQLFDPIKVPSDQAQIRWSYSTVGMSPSLWSFIPIPSVSDGTKGLHADGVVSLTIPADWAAQAPSAVWIDNLPQQQSDEVKVPLYWVGMVVRNLTGAPTPVDISLGIDFILFNSVSAHNALTNSGAEQLGVGDGTAWQVFPLKYQPLYKRPDSDTPYDHLVVDVFDVKANSASTWQQVEDFPAGDGKFYKVNPVTGEVSFGNFDLANQTGNGHIPAVGDTITADTYRYASGGASGNVGPGAITSLRKSVPGIVGVTNLAAAYDGADEEAIEETMRRAPEALKTRDRAVTAEDYEYLAVEASTEVAIVRCLEPRVQGMNPPIGNEGDPWKYAGIIRSPGNINVIVVPNQGPAIARPKPTKELLLAVHAYLDKRRDVTARLAVVGPAYLPIKVTADVKVWQTALDSGLVQKESDVRDDTQKKVREFLHPTRGGPQGTGWQVGQLVYIMDLFKAIAPSEDVGYIAILTVLADTPDYHDPANQIYPDERPFDLGPAGASVRVADYELVCASTDVTGITAEKE